MQNPTLELCDLDFMLLGIESDLIRFIKHENKDVSKWAHNIFTAIKDVHMDMNGFIVDKIIGVENEHLILWKKNAIENMERMNNELKELDIIMKDNPSKETHAKIKELCFKIKKQRHRIKGLDKKLLNNNE